VIASGAGHDAAIFANAGVPAAMVFVRNEHGSHNPREAMAFDDFLVGAGLLQAVLLTGAEAIGA
jgi:N-carbamoyl-L-amino-acid hydrolase